MRSNLQSACAPPSAEMPPRRLDCPARWQGRAGSQPSAPAPAAPASPSNPSNFPSLPLSLNPPPRQAQRGESGTHTTIGQGCKHAHWTVACGPSWGGIQELPTCASRLCRLCCISDLTPDSAPASSGVVHGAALAMNASQPVKTGPSSKCAIQFASRCTLLLDPEPAAYRYLRHHQRRADCGRHRAAAPQPRSGNCSGRGRRGRPS